MCVCVCVCVYAYMYVYMHLFIFWSTVNATVFSVSVPDTSLLLYTNAANLWILIFLSYYFTPFIYQCPQQDRVSGTCKKKIEVKMLCPGWPSSQVGEKWAVCLPLAPPPHHQRPRWEALSCASSPPYSPTPCGTDSSAGCAQQDQVKQIKVALSCGGVSSQEGSELHASSPPCWRPGELWCCAEV